MEESRDREIVRYLEIVKSEMIVWEHDFGRNGSCARQEDGDKSERLMATSGIVFRDPVTEIFAIP